MNDLFSQLNSIIATIVNGLTEEGISTIYTTVIRFVLPLLAFLIIFRCGKSLLKYKAHNETWAFLALPTGDRIPLDHWENTIGRNKGCDVVLNLPQISRMHATLTRNADDTWQISDQNSSGGVYVNGNKVTTDTKLGFGDVISLSDLSMTLVPLSPEEQQAQAAMRPKAGRQINPVIMAILLTLFHLSTSIQMLFTADQEYYSNIVIVYVSLILVEWIYFIVMRSLKRTGFEVEILVFLLASIGFAVVCSKTPSDLITQFAAFVLGLLCFIFFGVFLRDLDRIKKYRLPIGAFAVLLFSANILLGFTKFGAKNWINLGFITFQPSEIVKVCFIFLGAATLDRLLTKKNLISYIIFTGFCGGSLALIGDFGAALIFFVTFIVIAFIRSGDWATIALFLGGAVLAVILILQVKPYVANRFAAWRNVWAYSSSLGYQQTRAMSAAASGGLFGMGIGNGWLSGIAAADTDLVFGVLCEEWGLLIALLVVSCFVILTLFAYKCSDRGRSSFYVIAACAATSMMLFQMGLNIFGCMDILPLTGVTIPFVSNGGTSMLSSWLLMAYVKAADTRYMASFATPTAGKGTHVVNKKEIESQVTDRPVHSEENIEINFEEDSNEFTGLFGSEYDSSDDDEDFVNIDTSIFPDVSDSENGRRHHK